MSSIDVVNKELILTKVTEKPFERGEEYYEWGMVESVVRRGSRLFAEVQGSENDLYHVGVDFQEADFSATCTCPYDWGGYCKHIVAALLTWIHQRESVEVRTPIEDLLLDLDAGRLRALVFHIVESEPGVADTIDEFCHPSVPSTQFG